MKRFLDGSDGVRRLWQCTASITTTAASFWGSGIASLREGTLARAFSGYEGLGVLRAGDRVLEAPGLLSNPGRLKTSL